MYIRLYYFKSSQLTNRTYVMLGRLLESRVVFALFRMENIAFHCFKSDDLLSKGFCFLRDRMVCRDAGWVGPSPAAVHLCSWPLLLPYLEDSLLRPDPVYLYPETA